MAVEYHVDPSGDDNNAGTKHAPFATLRKARNALRKATDEERSEAVKVVLHGGVYRLEEALVLTPEDSGTDDHPVRYVAAPGEEPIISGGRRIDDWSPVTESIPGLPADARDHVWVADLPRVDGNPVTFSALLDGDGLLPRAHTPSRTHTDRDEDESGETLYNEVHVGDDPIGWSNEADAEVFLTPHYPWTVNYLPISSVDEAAGIIETALPATYPIKKPWSRGAEDGFYRVENVFEGLDAPGRWVVDTDAEKVYLWPREASTSTEGSGGQDPQGVVAPAVTELVRFEGDLGDRRWVRHIEFDGITFAHGDRMVWEPGRVSLQHDWEQHDEPNALVRLRGAEHVRVSNCRFTASGSSGIRLDRHAVDCTVERCELTELGGTGVVLDGYGPGSRDENHHNRVVGNHVHRVARLWWHSSGIFVAQSGHNEIRDNCIHSLPYTGIIVSGLRSHVFESEDAAHEGHRTIRKEELRETPFEPPYYLGLKHTRYNQIEHNEVHDVMRKLGDGNGIYLSGTGEGNVVRRNYVHDVTGSGTDSGIRMDDEQFHTLTTENVVHRINGSGIVGKRVNQIQNNVVVDCYMQEQSHHAHIAVHHRGPCHGAGIRRNVIVQPDREDRLPFVAFTDLFEHTLTDDNLYHSLADETAAEETIATLRDQNQGTRSIAADPDFVDPDANDFRIPPDSPARDVGFRPFETWGPTGEVGPANQ